MNYRVVLRILGKILCVGGALMLFPLLIALIYKEYTVMLWLLVPIAAQLAIGGGLQFIRKDKLQGEKIYAKEGFVVVALAWVLLSLFSALPYTLGGYIPSYIDAVFEMVSGFTTTGATILGDSVVIEDLPQALLMWRAFTHWIGGMGVLVFVMAFLPQSDIKSIHLMRAEVPGPSVGKLVSRIRLTARILYGIYLGLTVVQFVLLLCGGIGGVLGVNLRKR
jgi:trk system potassium uptake protein TrkH